MVRYFPYFLLLPGYVAVHHQVDEERPLMIQHCLNRRGDLGRLRDPDARNPHGPGQADKIQIRPLQVEKSWKRRGEILWFEALLRPVVQQVELEQAIAVVVADAK